MAKQIGQSFGGVVLTREEYQRVEDAYVAAEPLADQLLDRLAGDNASLTWTP
jgi:hypothetical protein